MDPNYKNNIPPALRAAREAGGISREELADHLGISVKSVQNYESGLRLPPSDLSASWCEACGYPFSLYLAHVYHLHTADFDSDADRKTILAFADSAPADLLHAISNLIRILQKG